jgi:hypothetical protein
MLIISFLICMPPVTGFGFVWFRDKLAMEDACRDMHNRELNGRKISCTRAVPMNETRPGTPAGQLGGGEGARTREIPRGERRGYPPRGGDYPPRGGPDRGYDRGPDRGYDRGPDRSYDRGPDRGYDRGYSSYDRPTYDRGVGGSYGSDSRGGGGGGYGGGGGGDRGYDRGYGSGYVAFCPRLAPSSGST